MIDCTCVLGLIIILVLIIVVARRQFTEDSKPGSSDITSTTNSVPSLYGMEGIPAVKMPSDPQMALAQGRHLLVQGRRAEGIAFLIHALREGPSDVRQEAVCTLEESGEIETF